MARSTTKDNRTRAGRAGSQPKKKSKPTIFKCPFTEQNVYIERATLADLKSKSTYHSNGKKRLWILSSSQLRHELYADAAQAIASREQALLPSFGGRSWEVTCCMSEENSNTLFRAWKGKMELAVLPHVMEKIPDPPRWPGRKSQQLDEYFENDDDQSIVNLQSREVSTLSSVAWDLKHLYPVPVVSTKWLSPCRKNFTSRKMAWDHATELAKKEILIDKHILGIGATGKLLQPTIPSAPMALKIGKLRFERDGLWVVNQELTWQEDRQVVLEEEQAEDEARKETAGKKSKREKKRNSAGNNHGSGQQEIEIDSKQVYGWNSKKAMKTAPLSYGARKLEYREEKQNGLVGTKLTLKQAKSELRELWKTLSENEQTHWKERLSSSLACEGMSTESSGESCVEDIKQGEGDVENSNHKKSNSSSKNCATEIRVPHISATSQYLATLKSLTPSNMTPEPQVAVPKGVEEKNGEKSVTASQLRVLHRSSEVNSVTTLQTPQDSNEKKNADGSIRPNEAATNEGSVKPVESAKARDQNNKTSSIVQVSTRQSRGRQRSSRRKHPTDKAKQRWCLNDEQMELCYTSCMSHYEDVMRTVKARDLARELADGFDVLRERGRGRFDMELPAFDTEAFSFLIDLQKAPWMPIVKCILGEEVSLIHKGCFLSLPDAETQVYHQDGVHLNSQTQKPCHAINVFVPLVDLTPRNGPTEFCLGSHILGNEGFDKDFVEIPKPTAGTPVIFDYRLGHRGLGNSSSKCRPIVYCTYARGAVDGKEFRDSVNFSKRRYHKIGELTQKPLSREERRLNRKRSLESRQIKAEAKKIAKLEQQQTLAKGKENEVEKQNFVKSSVVSRPQNFDFPTDQNEWQANVAIEKIYSSEGKKTAEPCHLPPPVTTGDNQSD